MPFLTLPRFLFWILISCISQSQMSLVSVTEPTYEVQLTLDPSIDVIENGLTSVDMYSKHGQKFLCRIPDARVKNKTTQVQKVNTSYVTSLLGMNNRSACMLLKKDWWTYELCPYRYVLQFHQDGKKRVSEISLGSFESESNWDDFPNVTVDSPLKHKQWYNNGSVCDITYSHRKIEVRYECATVGFSGITKVEEVETCVYSMSVSVPGLCSHPLFAAQVAITSERIICSPATLPATPVKEHSDTQPITNAPSSLIGPRKSDPPDVFTLIRTRRNERKYRIMKRLLRSFLQTLSTPLPKSAYFGSHSAFSLYLEDLQSGSFCSTSFALSVDRSELKQWIDDGFVFATRLTKILEKIISHPKNWVSLQPAIRIVHSLVKLLLELVDHKQKQVSQPMSDHSPIHQQFANASRLLIRFCEDLLQNVDTNLTLRLASDLQAMYSDPEFSFSPSAVRLETISPDGITHVAIGLATKKRTPLCRTPAEAADLHDLVGLMGRQIVSIQQFQDTFFELERLRATESVLAATLNNLINGPQFRVVVLRSVDDSGKSSDTDSVDNPDSDQSFPASVLNMVKKAIQKASPQASENLEVYEAHNARGVATVFIVSAEDKRKEMRRMKTLEQAYNYMAPGQRHEND